MYKARKKIGDIVAITLFVIEVYVSEANIRPKFPQLLEMMDDDRARPSLALISPAFNNAHLRTVLPEPSTRS